MSRAVSALALARPRESYFDNVNLYVTPVIGQPPKHTHTQLGEGVGIIRRPILLRPPATARGRAASAGQSRTAIGHGPCGVIIAAPLDRSSSGVL